MNPIVVLLNELNKRIEVVSTQINEFENRKNVNLEIINLLFKYNISKEMITGNDLCKLSQEEFSKILELMNEPEKEMLIEKFYLNANIFNLFQKISNEYGKIEEAIQYNSANNWLNEMGLIISDYLSNFEKENNEHIKTLGDSIKNFKELYNNFQGEELIEPIFDMQSFDDLINKLGFTLEQKIAIKIAVGKANYDKIMKYDNSKEKDLALIDKYRLIYEKKLNIYENDINTIQNLCSELNIGLTINDDSILDQISSKCPNLSYETVKNAIYSILLMREIKLYEEFMNAKHTEIEIMEFKKNSLANFEKIVNILRKPKKKVEILEPKEEVIQPEEVSSSNAEFDEIISKINNIIENEKEFLQSISQNDNERLMILQNELSKVNLDENTIEKDRYTLGFIIETLKSSLPLFEKTYNEYQKIPEESEHIYKEQLNAMKEYLETYEIVKSRINNYKNNTNTVNNFQKYDIIYLLDENKNAFIKETLREFSSKEKSIMKKIIINLENGLFSESEILEINKIPISKIITDKIIVFYVTLNNYILVLFAGNNAKEIHNSINRNEKRIKKIITDSKNNIDDFNKLVDENKEEYNEVNKYFIEEQKK